MAPEHSNKKGHDVLGRHKKFSDSLFAWLSCSFEPLNEQLFLANHLESAQSSRVSTGCLQEASTSPGERQAGRHCTSASSALHRHQQHGSIYNPDMYSCSLQWEAGTAGCQPPTTRCLNQLKGWQRAHTHRDAYMSFSQESYPQWAQCFKNSMLCQGFRAESRQMCPHTTSPLPHSAQMGSSLLLRQPLTLVWLICL